jgi:hypothetical protein
MSRAAEQILEDMRRRKTGWRSIDFETLYLGYGFIKKGKKHDVYIHSKYHHIRDTIPRNQRDLSPGYAKDAVKNIDLLLRLEEEQGHND